MAKKTFGGYSWNHILHLAMNANKEARRALQRILNEMPGPERTALLLALASNKLGENLECLIELKEIGEEAKSARLQDE